MRWLCVAVVLLTSCAARAADGPPSRVESWIQLFDGESLFGWTSNNPDIPWKVVDGTITAGLPAGEKPPQGLLITDVPFADYELKCEFRLSPGGNSGVFLRTLEQPKVVDADCYEVNIADEHPQGYLTGSLVGRAKTAVPLKGSPEKGTDGWKSFQITAEGNHFVVQLDGKTVLEHTDKTAGQRSIGRIGLQQREGQVEFRKISLRPLGMKSLFNGKNTTGWRVVPGAKSDFKIEDQSVHLTGGPGFLETEATYGDFLLQVEAKTGKPAVNSGFFFRAMPGTEKDPSNGYEVQIDNTMKDGDRSKPANSGTGAIFRRAEARKVVANDQEWCTVTLAAFGPRLMTWVNGYPTVDWVDDRKPDPNPRRGKRVDAGHISLQGHDPTTDVFFGRMQIAPLTTGEK